MKKIGGRYRSSFLQKVNVALRLVEKDTQSLRTRLMDELEAMFKIAKDAAEAARASGAKPREVQNWMRIMGYLSQVMNSLSKSFDEAKALEYLKNMERMMRESEGNSEKG
ncbi:MAG: hypothetical protein ACP5IM_08020 [Candidatus Bathyarchaeia archaeon]